MADMVIRFGRYGFFRVADVVVADMVCGQYGCGRYGLWPIWYRPVEQASSRESPSLVKLNYRSVKCEVTR